MKNESIEGVFACVWVACGVLAIVGGILKKDPSTFAIVFLALTMGFKEVKP